MFGYASFGKQRDIIDVQTWENFFGGKATEA
jgi:hypothetical protein